jgi:hypothetical protein
MNSTIIFRIAIIVIVTQIFINAVMTIITITIASALRNSMVFAFR